MVVFNGTNGMVYIQSYTSLRYVALVKMYHVLEQISIHGIIVPSKHYWHSSRTRECVLCILAHIHLSWIIHLLMCLVYYAYTQIDMYKDRAFLVCIEYIRDILDTCIVCF